MDFYLVCLLLTIKARDLFLSVRKESCQERLKGKLPRETVSKVYALEYGTAEIEIHKEDIRPRQKIVFVDDLLATCGTAKAAIDLIEELGGVVVKVLFVMELEGLHGRDVLKGYDVESVITYPGK